MDALGSTVGVLKLLGNCNPAFAIKATHDMKILHVHASETLLWLLLHHPQVFPALLVPTKDFNLKITQTNRALEVESHNIHRWLASIF